MEANLGGIYVSGHHGRMFSPNCALFSKNRTLKEVLFDQLTYSLDKISSIILDVLKSTVFTTSKSKLRQYRLKC